MAADFFKFGVVDFPFIKVPFKSAPKSFFCVGAEIHPVLEVQFLMLLSVVILC